MKVLVVTKRSSYELMSENRDQFRDLKKRHPQTVRELEKSHGIHCRSIDRVCETITGRGCEIRREWRARLSSVAWADLVVTVGGDGTLLEAARHLTTTPVLAVNSDPGVSVAHFSACNAGNFPSTFDRLGSRAFPLRRIARLAVTLGDVPLGRPVLNDLLLAHRNPASTTRLSIREGRRENFFKCSGIWVATAAGSTAAAGSAGGRRFPLLSRKWQYLVREPYRHDGSVPVRRVMGPDERLTMTCLVGPARLYVDGPHRSVAVAIGERLEISPTAPDLRIYRRAGR